MTQSKIKKILIKIPFITYLHRVKTTGTVFTRPLSQKEKAQELIACAKKNKCKTLIETGTYKGDTIAACNNFFENLYSIELSPELYTISKKRFEGVNKIKILHGNSTTILPEIIRAAKGPILYWLDAHYSGGETACGEVESPIIQELDIILKQPGNNYILIDDARCFTGKSGYPKIGFIKKILKEHNRESNAQYILSVKNDIIKIMNKNG